MSVMACNRNGCGAILCDNYSSLTGYLCLDCKEELEESNPTTKQEVLSFLASPLVGDAIDINTLFEEK